MISDELDRGIAIHYVAILNRHIQFEIALLGGVGELNFGIILQGDIFSTADINITPFMGPKRL